jgi:hypothetical protein
MKSANSLWCLPHIAFSQQEVDRLGWTVEQNFIAYRLRFGLRSNNSTALEQAAPHLPLGWQAAPTGGVDILYSLWLAPPSKRQGQCNYHLFYCGPALIARTLDLSSLLTVFEKHAELLTAFRAQDCLFVHTGVVGWQDHLGQSTG